MIDTQQQPDIDPATTVQQDNPSPKPDSTPVSSTFDLDRLRLSQDFGSSLGVKKAILTIPVRKPDRHWFVRTHPSPEYRFETAIVEDEREAYLLDRSLWDDNVGEFAPKVLVTAINRQNVLFLWPIRLPGPDGRHDDWNTSALEAANLARTKWVRVAANMGLGAYDVFEASASLSEPEWPELSFGEIVKVAFKNHYINSAAHPVLRKLRGEL